MSFIGLGVNKLKRESLLLILILLLAWPAVAAEPFVVAPVKKAEDLRLLPAAAWPPPESDPAETLIKLTYLRGMLDALQYAEVAPKGASRVLRDLSGMSLGDLAAAVDRYYLADPRRRELPPAAVLFRLMPDQRGQAEAGNQPGGTGAPPESSPK